MSNQIALSGRDLSIAELKRAGEPGTRASVTAAARERMQTTRRTVDKAVETGRVSYGITTGFGAFANRHIPAHKVKELQLNLVRSHACGVGAPLAPATVRRLLLLKANNLAAGFSGVRPEVVDALLAMLAADVLPVIPGRGSVGASGDLAPLAHLALALIGEGSAVQGERQLTGTEVNAAARVEPLALEAKEGLALLNGTQLSTVLAAEGLADADNLLHSAIAIGALTVEALAGSHAPFDARIHDVRGQRGQNAVAALFRGYLTESEISHSHEQCDRVQDPYSVRCMPQVFGAALDAIEFARGIVTGELNGVSDNPLIFGDDILSGGNFHAAPLALASDLLAIVLTDLGSMSERRTDLLDRRVNPNLNMFLTSEPGVESGFMIAHVTAAALASENKTLAHPASVDSLPTSAGQEDHVSMAPWAGHKLKRICDNCYYILAIELLAAAHAIDSMRPLRSSIALEELHGRVRRLVPYDRRDHRLDQPIEKLAARLKEGEFAGPTAGA
jgi:histidine ammonia-lyase